GRAPDGESDPPGDPRRAPRGAPPRDARRAGRTGRLPPGLAREDLRPARLTGSRGADARAPLAAPGAALPRGGGAPGGRAPRAGAALAGPGRRLARRPDRARLRVAGGERRARFPPDRRLGVDGHPAVAALEGVRVLRVLGDVEPQELLLVADPEPDERVD